MKNPTHYSGDEEALAPFVLCAKTDSLRDACRLLFLHGNDLTVGSKEILLVRVSLGEGFSRARDLAKARSELGLRALVREVYPLFEKVLMPLLKAQPFHPVEDPDRSSEVISKAFQNWFKEQRIEESMIPVLAARANLAVDTLASELCHQMLEIRRRHLAASAYSAEEYEALISALYQAGVLDVPFLRIEYPTDRGSARVVLSGAADSRDRHETRNDGHVMELWRLGGELGRLKRDSDHALGLFIAAYLNQHAWDRRQAFANARYGTSDEHELDVVIPALDLGIEVKLHQAPMAAGTHKLKSCSGKLASQVGRYIEAGCLRIIIVTNLPSSESKELLRETRRRLGERLAGVDLDVVSGLEDTLMTLSDILDDLDNATAIHLDAQFADPHSEGGDEDAIEIGGDTSTTGEEDGVGAEETEAAVEEPNPAEEAEAGADDDLQEQLDDAQRERDEALARVAELEQELKAKADGDEPQVMSAELQREIAARHAETALNSGRIVPKEKDVYAGGLRGPK